MDALFRVSYFLTSSNDLFTENINKAKMDDTLNNSNADIVADKELRVSFDIQLQKLKSLPSSRERAIAITKLQEAIMWIGMDLKRIGDANPYPNSYNPENLVIDKTADGLKL